MYFILSVVHFTAAAAILRLEEGASQRVNRTYIKQHVVRLASYSSTGYSWGNQLMKDEVQAVGRRLHVGNSHRNMTVDLSKFEQNADFDASLLDVSSSTSVHGAYVLFGTDPTYARAACAVAAQLRSLQTSSTLDLVALHGGDAGAKAQLEKCQFDHVLQIDTSHLRSTPGYYSDCAIKLASFGQPPLNKYERIVQLDSDALPLKNMDSLFNVPKKYDFFGPRAYWIDPGTVTSGLMGIKPSESLHASLLQQWQQDNGADMDVVNHYFETEQHRPEMGYLPANFLVLDSHWHRDEERKPPTPNEYPGEKLDDVYLIHWTGYQKPWFHTREDDLSHFSEELHPVLRRWWDLWEHVPQPR